jgi:hypothetical protein
MRSVLIYPYGPSSAASLRHECPPELLERVYRNVVEESDEALGWLEFMRDGELATDAALLNEASELSTFYFLLSTFYFLLTVELPNASASRRCSSNISRGTRGPSDVKNVA